jgi:hypothetical protein
MRVSMATKAPMLLSALVAIIVLEIRLPKYSVQLIFSAQLKLQYHHHVLPTLIVHPSPLHNQTAQPSLGSMEQQAVLPVLALLETFALHNL